MESLKRKYFKVKPIFHVFLFEINSQVKKFFILLFITILQLFLTSYLVYIFRSRLAGSIDWFYYYGTNYFLTIITFAVCYLFSGIICSEFKEKTGLSLFPLISRYKLMIGKYFANISLLISLTTVHYLVLIFLGYYFYGEPILNSWILSYGFSIFNIFALSSIVIFFSSFMKSPNQVIIIVFGLIYFGFTLINDLILQISEGTNFKFIFSLTYLQSLILRIMIQDFFASDNHGIYLSVELVTTILLSYTIIFLILAILIFRRREL